MKKIAADRNYRMLKGAQTVMRSEEEHNNYIKVKSKLVELSRGAPGDDGAFIVFEAIRNTTLIKKLCRDVEGDPELEREGNKYKNICMPHIDGYGTLKALRLTEDVMTGMNLAVWEKYKAILFREIKVKAPTKAVALIGWIVGE